MAFQNKNSDLVNFEKLISFNGNFIFDTSFIKSNGFEIFINNIRTAVENNKERFIIPGFVYEKLDIKEKNAYKNLFNVVNGASDYKELIQLLISKGKKNFNFYVNDLMNGKKIYAVCKSLNIERIYLFEINESGKTGPFNFKKQPSENTYAQKSQTYTVKQNNSQNKNFNTSNVPSGEKTVNKDSNSSSGARSAYFNKSSADKTASCQQTKKAETVFSVKDKPEKIKFEYISVTGELCVGDTVFDKSGKAYRLIESKCPNNGAVTYSSDCEGIWIKIYNSRSLNTFIYEKIKRMLNQKMDKEGLCWPLDIVYDKEGKFRGYILKAFSGHSLQLGIFKRAGIEKYFSDWDRRNLCDLALSILEKISFLHERNVLFGCLNPASIRIAGKNEVYFTDTDNYQIDGFPSVVYNNTFTPPELLGNKMYLVSLQNEYYSVAELIFMIMMPGKTPYSISSNESAEELIKKMQFPYFANNRNLKNNSEIMPGIWQFMWSHLNSSMSGAFCNVFQKDSKYNHPEDRKDSGYWKWAVTEYKKYLDSLENEDSRKIYPDTFKRTADEEFIKCNYCGVMHPRYYFRNQFFDFARICNSCIENRSDDSFTCQSCGKEYFYTNKSALYHRMKKQENESWREQKYCSDCKKKTSKCSSCSEETPYFYLDENEVCIKCRFELKKKTGLFKT